MGVNMILDDNLYISDSLKKNINKIKDTIKAQKVELRLYCITLASNPKNLFDIHYYNELLQPYYKDKDKEIIVIGIGKTKEEAIDLVIKIIETVYNNTNTFDIRKYLGYSTECDIIKES